MNGRVLAVVATPHDETRAHLMAAVLRGAGIPAHVEITNGWVHEAYPSHGGFPIRVPAQLSTLAADVLQRSRKSHPPRSPRKVDSREQDPREHEVGRFSGPEPFIEGILQTLYRHLLVGVLFPPLGLIMGPLGWRCALDALDCYDRLLIDDRTFEARLELARSRARAYTILYYLSAIVVISCASFSMVR